jgi:hypothetical protein
MGKAIYAIDAFPDESFEEGRPTRRRRRRLVADLGRKLRLFAVRALAPQQIEPAQSERPDPDEHLVSDRLGPANVLDP